MFADIFQKSKEAKSLLGLNYYGSDNEFYCGYILDYNSDFVIVRHFSKFGEEDGVLVLKIADIKYCETETEYLSAIKLLITNRIEIQNSEFIYDSKNNHFKEFLSLFESLIGSKKHLVKIETNDDQAYIGFIEWCDDDFFLITELDNVGKVMGKNTFKFEDLKLYWIDDLECRRRQFLFNARSKK